MKKEVLSRAEKILHCWEEPIKCSKNPVMAMYEVMQDCLAVNRIEKKISDLSQAAYFNEGPLKEMSRQYDLLDEILDKYGLPKSADDEN